MIKHAPLNLYKSLKRSKELANNLLTHQGTGRDPRERSESRLWKVDFWIFDIFTKLEKILRPPKSESQKFPSFWGFSERIPKRLKIGENVYLLGKSYTDIKIQKFPKSRILAPNPDFRFWVRWFRPKFGPPKIEITIFYPVFGLFGSCFITKKNLVKKWCCLKKLSRFEKKNFGQKSKIFENFRKFRLRTCFFWVTTTGHNLNEKRLKAR